ncbi:DUF3006 domain-containing protein [Bacillus sp. JCM 19034]|uniref:DUF3006 domain-containing protein n=1 Tax=Bacillus sp. JCM 19034 TaxID=1481928 RepID=UPI0007861145|nr:DUF3006 domain-containing protein [Bacillus sp. JCM 19034]
MNVRAVIDRIVNDRIAVLVAEEVNKEYSVPKEQLPEGANEGTWLSLVVEQDQVMEMAIDKNMTETMEERVKNQLSRLQQKSRGSRFKRK